MFVVNYKGYSIYVFRDAKKHLGEFLEEPIAGRIEKNNIAICYKDLPNTKEEVFIDFLKHEIDKYDGKWILSKENQYEQRFRGIKRYN